MSSNYSQQHYQHSRSPSSSPQDTTYHTSQRGGQYSSQAHDGYQAHAADPRGHSGISTDYTGAPGQLYPLQFPHAPPSSRGYPASDDNRGLTSSASGYHPGHESYSAPTFPNSSHSQNRGQQDPYHPGFIPTPSQTAHSLYPINPGSQTHAPQGLYHHAPGTSSSSTPSSPTGERIPCPKCEKTFSRAHDMRRHYETHHDPMPPNHTCRYCKKGFNRADTLKRHIDNGCDKMPK